MDDGGPSTRENGVMPGPDDATLARGAQAGDASSLGVLFERHRARLHAVAIGMLGHGPDAEDAVQDAIVIAIRRIGELREPAAAGGWLVASLVHVCRARRRLNGPEPSGAVPPAWRGAGDTLPATVERGALRDWVWTALERLPEPQRVAIMLRHFSTANSYDAIADICDVPVGTVRSRLNAARKRLTDELLATAATAHTDRDALHDWTLATGAAMLAFQRTGDPALLESVYAPDLAFRMADRVERRGRAQLAAGLARDFEDGVTARVLRVIPGEHVAITELLLENPREQPLHCPPAVTQLHYHDAGRTHRLVSYYAPRT
jgi:RNA polymerase sigma-70 factor (ECF subfamily)